jgi:3-hydroxybutyryl-CoA dehydrogenase
MQLVVVINEILKEELLSTGINGEIDFIWTTNIEDCFHYKTADGFIDLLFDNSTERISILKKLLPATVVVNSVIKTLKKMDAPFVRINAWPGFLKRQIVEASYNDKSIRIQADKIFSFLNKKIEWVEDEPGFVTPRIIAMIINEAFFALEEKISIKKEIDIAMKLGTNYPYGPFEWSEIIGSKKVCDLLDELSESNDRYRPASLLKKEAIK